MNSGQKLLPAVTERGDYVYRDGSRICRKDGHVYTAYWADGTPLTGGDEFDDDEVISEFSRAENGAIALLSGREGPYVEPWAPVYRRKPTEVEAIQFDGSSMKEWGGDFVYYFRGRLGTQKLIVETKNSSQTANIGDWVVRHPEQGFCVMTDSEFSAKYDLIRN